jgi:hypothetical protein
MIGYGNSVFLRRFDSTGITPPPALLLDTYTGAAVAYSLRKLRTAYTGAAIRVRRTDLAEQDISFDSNGDLDTTALLSFVGTGALNNGFITTWYDQSTNANNSTQATALSQAQIVSAGALILDPNTSKITTTWTTDSYSLTTSISPNTRYLSIGVINRTANNINIASLGTGAFGGVNGQQPLFWIATTGALRSDMSSSVTHSTNTSTGAFIISSEKNSSDLKIAYINGSALATTATQVASGGNDFLYFGRSGTNTTSGRYAEYIYWDLEQSANRTGIETNINTYWNAY